MRLGFVARSLAKPALRSHDSRRWQNNPHLSVSLAYLRDMFVYLAQAGINMYRMSSDLAPYANHPDLPQFRDQVAECAAELQALGLQAQALGLRLSFHTGQHVVLNSPDPMLVQRSAADIITQSAILDAMGLGPEAVVVVHMGGLYGDRSEARSRFAHNLAAAIPEAARQRLALENDDTRFGVEDTLLVHEQTAIRLVFDSLHHRLYNPSGMPAREALATCLSTWPSGSKPKVHFSSPRTEMNVEMQPHNRPPRIRPPQWRNHSDYANPFEFIDLMEVASGLPDFDVMLEVCAKDLALLQLRRDLTRYAPALATTLQPPTDTADRKVIV